MSKMTAVQRRQKKIESYPLWTLFWSETPDPERFDFNAKDEAEALSLALAWGRRAGADRRSISVKRAMRSAASTYWHNEYVDHFRD
jgi:hypothetical protein